MNLVFKNLSIMFIGLGQGGIIWGKTRECKSIFKIFSSQWLSVYWIKMTFAFMKGERDSVMLKIFTDLVLNIPFEVFLLAKRIKCMGTVIGSIKDFK